MVFLVFGVLAARHLDLDIADLGWGWLALAGLIGVPLTVVATAAEYKVSARATGVRVRWPEALGTTILATTANLLPLPGGALVRVQALRGYGTPFRRATLVTGLMGISWVGLAALLAGLLMLTSNPGVAILCVSVGALLLVVAGAIVHRLAPATRRVMLGIRVLSVELISILVTAFRLYLVLLALGIRPSFVSAAFLTLATIIGSAVGIFPGGLGVKETLAAVFAPVVGLPGSVGFLVAAVNRVIGLIVLAPLALLVALYRSNENSVQQVTGPS